MHFLHCVLLPVVIFWMATHYVMGSKEVDNVIEEISHNPRQRRAWSVLQRNWRKVLIGTRLVGKKEHLRVYEKRGFYDQALRDFHSLQPQYVSQTTTDAVEVYGRIGNTEIYLRGKSPDFPDNVHAVLHIDGKLSATQWQLPSDFRITKEIVYVTN